MASGNVGKLSVEVNADTAKAKKEITSFSNIAREAIIGNIVTKGLDVAMDAAKSFASSVVSVGSNFEKSMSEVAAITGATGDDLAMLEQTARDFGASTQFSASEAAEALKYMGLAGWDAR